MKLPGNEGGAVEMGSLPAPGKGLLDMGRGNPGGLPGGREAFRTRMKENMLGWKE